MTRQRPSYQVTWPHSSTRLQELSLRWTYTSLKLDGYPPLKRLVQIILNLEALCPHLSVLCRMKEDMTKYRAQIETKFGSRNQLKRLQRRAESSKLLISLGTFLTVVLMKKIRSSLTNSTRSFHESKLKSYLRKSPKAPPSGSTM